MYDSDGNPHDVAADAVGTAQARGYSVAEPGARAAITANTVAEQAAGGIKGKAEAFGAGVLRGGSGGLSDVALTGLYGERGQRQLSELKQYNPGLSTAGNVIGAVAPALLTGGESLAATEGIGASILAASPAGLTSRLGSTIAKLGEGAGFLGETAATVGAGAAEGALMNAGSYVSDVALGDKKLSAEGFQAAMGEGALWGGGAAGALSVSSRAVSSLRNLIPRAELTREAVEKATSEATSTLRRAVDDGDALIAAGRQEMDMIRIGHAADPLVKAELDSIAVAKSRELASVAAPQVAREALPSAANIASEAAGSPASLLERQLMGTKVGLDAGESISQIGARAKPTAVTDAMNARIAEIDPRMATLVRATEEAEAAKGAVGRFLDKHAVEAKPQTLEELLAGTKAKLDAGESISQIGSKAPRSIAEEITAGADARAATTVDEKVASAVGAKPKDFHGDILDGVDSIGRMEAAHADLTEALGAKAPLSSQAHAAAMRETQESVTSGINQANSEAAQDAAKLAARAEAGEAGATKSLASKVVHGAMKAGEYAEILRHLGVPVPDPAHIPIIGPVLSMFLKGKVLARAAGINFGGAVGKTAETVIAAKSAAVRQQVLTAVDKMLEGTSSVMAKGAPRAGGAAAVLGHSLFQTQGVKAESVAKGDLAALYAARAKEIDMASQPDAVRAAVRERVRASDPGIVDAITEATQRKLDFLASKMPRPNSPAGLLEGKLPWTPGKQQILEWAKFVEAAESPVKAFQHLADGGTITKQAAETIRAVYPALYNVAQQRLIDRAIDNSSTVSMARRVMLSALFELPMDRGTEPGYLAFTQGGYKAKATPPMPPQGAAPPTPTISADVNLGQAAMPPGTLGG